MLTNQVPGSETNMSDMLQMVVASTNAATQVRGNELLEHNVRLNHAMFSTMMSEFEGQLVDHQADLFHYQGAPQTIRYDYPKQAESMKIAILDEAHHLVFAQDLSRDEQEVIWDGTNKQGDPLPHGLYHVVVEAFDQNMEPIEDESMVWLRNKVTEVRFDKHDLPVLMSGKLPIGDVRSYRHAPLDIPYAPSRPLMVSQAVNTLE